MLTALITAVLGAMFSFEGVGHPGGGFIDADDHLWCNTIGGMTIRSPGVNAFGVRLRNNTKIECQGREVINGDDDIIIDVWILNYDFTTTQVDQSVISFSISESTQTYQLGIRDNLIYIRSLSNIECTLPTSTQPLVWQQIRATISSTGVFLQLGPDAAITCSIRLQPQQQYSITDVVMLNGGVGTIAISNLMITGKTAMVKKRLSRTLDIENGHTGSEVVAHWDFTSPSSTVFDMTGRGHHLVGDQRLSYVDLITQSPSALVSSNSSTWASVNPLSQYFPATKTTQRGPSFSVLLWYRQLVELNGISKLISFSRSKNESVESEPFMLFVEYKSSSFPKVVVQLSEYKCESPSQAITSNIGWWHFGISLSPRGVCIYVNSVLVKKCTIGEDSSAVSELNNIRFGDIYPQLGTSNGKYSDERFDYLVKDVRLFSGIISSSVVVRYYQMGVIKKQINLKSNEKIFINYNNFNLYSKRQKATCVDHSNNLINAAPLSGGVDVFGSRIVADQILHVPVVIFDGSINSVMVTTALTTEISRELLMGSVQIEIGFFSQNYYQSKSISLLGYQKSDRFGWNLLVSVGPRNEYISVHTNGGGCTANITSVSKWNNLLVVVSRTRRQEVKLRNPKTYINEQITIKSTDGTSQCSSVVDEDVIESELLYFKQFPSDNRLTVGGSLQSNCSGIAGVPCSDLLPFFGRVSYVKISTPGIELVESLKPTETRELIPVWVTTLPSSSSVILDESFYKNRPARVSSKAKVMFSPSKKEHSYSVEFNGRDDSLISLGPAILLQRLFSKQELSISMWVKSAIPTDGNTGNKYLFYSQGVQLYSSHEAPAALTFSISSDQNYFNTSCTASLPEISIPLSWVHLTAVFNPWEASMTLYCSGSLRKKCHYSPSSDDVFGIVDFNNDYDVTIGKGFTGSVGPFSLYNSAIRPSDARLLYQKMLPTSYTREAWMGGFQLSNNPLQLWYNFETNENNIQFDSGQMIIPDQSGSDNHGRFYFGRNPIFVKDDSLSFYYLKMKSEERVALPMSTNAVEKSFVDKGTGMLMAFWIKVSSLSTQQTIVSDNTNRLRSGYNIQCSTEGQVSVRINLPKRNIISTESRDGIIKKGVWHHVGLYISEEGIQLFVDGESSSEKKFFSIMISETPPSLLSSRIEFRGPTQDGEYLMLSDVVTLSVDEAYKTVMQLYSRRFNSSLQIVKSSCSGRFTAAIVSFSGMSFYNSLRFYIDGYDVGESLASELPSLNSDSGLAVAGRTAIVSTTKGVFIFRKLSPTLNSNKLSLAQKISSIELPTERFVGGNYESTSNTTTGIPLSNIAKVIYDNIKLRKSKYPPTGYDGVFVPVGTSNPQSGYIINIGKVSEITKIVVASGRCYRESCWPLSFKLAYLNPSTGKWDTLPSVLTMPMKSTAPYYQIFDMTSVSGKLLTSTVSLYNVIGVNPDTGSVRMNAFVIFNELMTTFDKPPLIALSEYLYISVKNNNHLFDITDCFGCKWSSSSSVESKTDSGCSLSSVSHNSHGGWCPDMKTEVIGYLPYVEILFTMDTFISNVITIPRSMKSQIEIVKEYEVLCGISSKKHVLEWSSVGVFFGGILVEFERPIECLKLRFIPKKWTNSPSMRVGIYSTSFTDCDTSTVYVFKQIGDGFHLSNTISTNSKVIAVRGGVAVIGQLVFVNGKFQKRIPSYGILLSGSISDDLGIIVLLFKQMVNTNTRLVVYKNSHTEIHELQSVIIPDETCSDLSVTNSGTSSHKNVFVVCDNGMSIKLFQIRGRVVSQIKTSPSALRLNSIESSQGDLCHENIKTELSTMSVEQTNRERWIQKSNKQTSCSSQKQFHIGDSMSFRCISQDCDEFMSSPESHFIEQISETSSTGVNPVLKLVQKTSITPSSSITSDHHLLSVSQPLIISPERRGDNDCFIVGGEGVAVGLKFEKLKNEKKWKSTSLTERTISNSVWNSSVQDYVIGNDTLTLDKCSSDGIISSPQLISDSVLIQTGEVSLSFWFKLKQNASQPLHIKDYLVYCEHVSSSSVSAVFSIDFVLGSSSIRIYSSFIDGTSNDYIVDYNFNQGSWYHLTVVRYLDDDFQPAMSIYINGIILKKIKTSLPDPALYSCYVGYSSSAPVAYSMPIVVKDVFIFKSPLIPSLIKKLSQNSISVEVLSQNLIAADGCSAFWRNNKNNFNAKTVLTTNCNLLSATNYYIVLTDESIVSMNDWKVDTIIISMKLLHHFNGIIFLLVLDSSPSIHVFRVVEHLEGDVSVTLKHSINNSTLELPSNSNLNIDFSISNYREPYLFIQLTTSDSRSTLLLHAYHVDIKLDGSGIALSLFWRNFFPFKNENENRQTDSYQIPSVGMSYSNSSSKSIGSIPRDAHSVSFISRFVLTHTTNIDSDIILFEIDNSNSMPSCSIKYSLDRIECGLGDNVNPGTRCFIQINSMTTNEAFVIGWRYRYLEHGAESVVDMWLVTEFHTQVLHQQCKYPDVTVFKSDDGGYGKTLVSPSELFTGYAGPSELYIDATGLTEYAIRSRLTTLLNVPQNNILNPNNPSADTVFVYDSHSCEGTPTLLTPDSDDDYLGSGYWSSCSKGLNKFTTGIRSVFIPSSQHAVEVIGTNGLMSVGFVGCYVDSSSETHAKDLRIRISGSHTISSCSAACADYMLFALRNYGSCFCGDSFTDEELPTDSIQCGTACTSETAPSSILGNDRFCGTSNRTAVYSQNGICSSLLGFDDEVISRSGIKKKFISSDDGCVSLNSNSYFAVRFIAGYTSVNDTVGGVGFRPSLLSSEGGNLMILSSDKKSIIVVRYDGVVLQTIFSPLEVLTFVVSASTFETKLLVLSRNINTVDSFIFIYDQEGDQREDDQKDSRGLYSIVAVISSVDEFESKSLNNFTTKSKWISASLTSSSVIVSGEDGLISMMEIPSQSGIQRSDCSTNELFNGYSCLPGDCYKGCSGHGQCGPNASCQCDPGYVGKHCENTLPCEVVKNIIQIPFKCSDG